MGGLTDRLRVHESTLKNGTSYNQEWIAYIRKLIPADILERLERVLSRRGRTKHIGPYEYQYPKGNNNQHTTKITNQYFPKIDNKDKVVVDAKRTIETTIERDDQVWRDSDTLEFGQMEDDRYVNIHISEYKNNRYIYIRMLDKARGWEIEYLADENGSISGFCYLERTTVETDGKTKRISISQPGKNHVAQGYFIYEESIKNDEGEFIPYLEVTITKDGIGDVTVTKNGISQIIMHRGDGRTVFEEIPEEIKLILTRLPSYQELMDRKNKLLGIETTEEFIFGKNHERVPDREGRAE